MIWLRKVTYWILQRDRWHARAQESGFVWARYLRASDEWETKPMADDEAAEAEIFWAMR